MITLTYASSADGHLRSSSSSYSTALSGSSLIVFDTEANLTAGQWFDSAASTYRLYQSFLEFAYTAPTDSVTVGGQWVIKSLSVSGTNVDRTLDFIEFDWGGTVDTSDWQNPSELTAGLPSAAFLQEAQRSGSFNTYWGMRDVEDGDTSATNRYVIASNRNRFQQTPSGEERNHFASTEHSGGNTNDPFFEVFSVAEQLLNRTLGAQVQLTDGTTVYLSVDAVSGGTYTLTLNHNNQGTETQIDSFDLSSEDFRGAQSYALCSDDSDNLYLFNPFVDNVNQINCRAFIKGSGLNWARGTLRRASIPEDDYKAEVNNLVCAWHNVGSGGTIMVLGMRSWGRYTVGAQDPFLLLDANYLLTGSGSLIKSSGRAGDVDLVPWPGNPGFYNPINPMGTLMDVCKAPGSDTRGFLMTSERNQLSGARAGQAICRYQLNGTGTGFEAVNSFIDSSNGFSVKDPEAKSRIVAISDRRFVTANADSDTGKGITVKHRKNDPGSSVFETLATVFLDDESLSTMPSASTLSTSSAWDLFHNPVDNTVWIYYFDVGDDQRLMRTQVDLTSGLAVQNETEVTGAVGASGSTNHAIRIHRGPTQGSDVIVAVANETSGGSHSVIYVHDFVNAAPTQPTLVVEPNFDADDPVTFEWVFGDPDSGDSQSAFQLQIDNASTGASAYDSGKTVSGTESHTVSGGTLTNGVDYRWRVRTWDSQDDVSPWSEYSTFTTSNTGSLTITVPSTDNDPTIFTADVTVEWTVTGATQDEYQVVVTRTDDGSTHIDTGRVSSTNTSFEVTGMASDVEYDVAVTAWDTDVATNTANRLITPDYDTPEVPLISVTQVSSGAYILVDITNPTARGDRPEPTHNDVYRRKSGSTDKYLFVGTTDPNSSFRDYSAASGILYEYKVRAGVEAG